MDETETEIEVEVKSEEEPGTSEPRRQTISAPASPEQKPSTSVADTSVTLNTSASFPSLDTTIPTCLSESQEKDFVIPVSPVKNLTESSPTKRERGGIPLTPESRARYHRESAELAKKKIRVDLNPSENERTAGGTEAENLCEQSECSDKHCVLAVNANCSVKSEGSGELTYYHITKGEHVCFFCFEDLIRVSRPIFDRYIEWKKQWVEVSRCTPNVRFFICERLLPYYGNCSSCLRFRLLPPGSPPLTPQFLETFTCSSINLACTEPESARVQEARKISFIQTISVPPLLQEAPSVHFLKGEYYIDEIGFSPLNDDYFLEECTTAKFMSPFNNPTEQSMAFSVRPDVMEFDEVHAFPEYANEPVPYLAMRNLMVALWNINPFERLTYERCLRCLVCRGLIRVWYGVQLRRVFDYLEMKSVINYGFVEMPKVPLMNRLLPNEKNPLSVIVIGAGISGLGVARQLRSFGAKVTVLEAKTRAGGRMQDDWSLGVAVGCGAQLITGILNNPIVVMCEQANVKYRRLEDDCPLIDSHVGQLVNAAADRLTDEHFNSILDAIGHWKQTTKTGDVSLMDQINNVHQKLLSAVDFRWTKEHERLFQWQIGNVEFSCGSRLTDVSARHWDQNEAVGQFAGEHALLADGSSEIIRRLSEGLDIRCSSPVVSIDYSKPQKIMVRCENGKFYYADKVVCAMPLAVFHRGIVTFKPELPDEKSLALRNLGAGLIEKIAVRFPRRFWSHLLRSDGTIDYFGNVPKSSGDRGLFNMFYDFSSRASSAKNQQYVLMSYVCGDSVDIVNTKSDVEVVNSFVDALQELFPEETIPTPTGYVVTHWGRDVYIGMSYSYLKVGGCGSHYDMMARPVNNRLYFCGEATNRFFPQTMTGSYVSALREAGRITEHYLNSKKASMKSL